MAVKKTRAAEPAEETVKKPAKEPEKDAEKASFFVYLGPSILGVIQKASIYPGTRAEVEEKLADAILKYPRIRTLLVGADEIPTGRIDVEKPGTRLYAEYRQLVNELRK